MSDTYDVSAILKNGEVLSGMDVTYQLLFAEKLVLIEGPHGTNWLNWDNVASFASGPHKDEDA